MYSAPDLAEVERPGPWLADFLAGVIEPALTLAAAIGLVWSVYVGTRAIYRRTLGSRRDLTKRIDKLGVGLSQDAVEDLFGKPLLRKKNEDGSEVLTYLPKHAWVSVLLGDDGAISAFSVTTVDERFHYSTRHHTFGQMDVRLGASNFADAQEFLRSHGANLGISPHRRDYRQIHYLANPGCYLSVVVMNSDTGIESRRHQRREAKRLASNGGTEPLVGRMPARNWITGEFRTDLQDATGVPGAPDDDHSWLDELNDITVITGFTITPSHTLNPETDYQWARRIHPEDRYFKGLRTQFKQWRDRQT